MINREKRLADLRAAAHLPGGDSQTEWEIRGRTGSLLGAGRFPLPPAVPDFEARGLIVFEGMTVSTWIYRATEKWGEGDD